jgi:hypothetical protein
MARAAATFLMVAATAAANASHLRPEIRTDRAVFHPGERIHLMSSLKNGGSPVLVPRLSFDRRFLVVTLHIATPAGAEYTYASLADRPLRDLLKP